MGRPSVQLFIPLLIGTGHRNKTRKNWNLDETIVLIISKTIQND